MISDDCEEPRLKIQYLMLFQFVYQQLKYLHHSILAVIIVLQVLHTQDGHEVGIAVIQFAYMLQIP